MTTIQRSMGVAMILTVPVVFWALSPVGHSSPLDGGIEQKRLEVPAEGLSITKRFRGGERASVHVVGDHKSDTRVHITVHDEKGKLIAEDKARELPIGDIGAVIWYPPRDGAYRITVRNAEAKASKYWIAIR